MEIIFKSISIKSGLKPELLKALRLVKIVNVAFIIEFIFKRSPKTLSWNFYRASLLLSATVWLG